MALDPNVASTLTNEARLRIAREKVARLLGQKTALGSLMTSLNGVSNDTDTSLTAAKADLATLEAGAGPGVSTDFGPYSNMDQSLQNERSAGKSALIDYVKQNPLCLEADAIAQWKTAALKGRPLDRQYLLIDPSALRQEYSYFLVAGKYITDMSWASFSAWVVATPKDVIMNM